ncbi:MAG TPA: M56 family metallopeptidase [Longimicrobium sp.]|nr:M56 family metallopeptidase [Longimicrobium sp.]
MTIVWVIRALAAGVLLAAAALYAERVAGWFGQPRRWAWAAAMAATVLLPLAALVAPGLFPPMDAPVAEAVVFAAPGDAGTADAADGSPSSAVAAVPFGRVFAIGWMLASAAMLLVLGVACRRMDATLRGLPGARLHGVKVRVADDTGPAAVGILMPEVVVPRWVLDAPEAEARLIVWHEREHVAAGDVQLLALAAAALVVMPWHPALWWQYRRLRLAVETDCDARVLAAVPGVRRYALALLRAAETSRAAPLLAPAWGERPSHLERRIAAMTATRPAHRVPRTVAAAAAACCLLAAACDVLESRGAVADARHAAVPRVVEEGVDANGRAYQNVDNADGTMSISVGPDPSKPHGWLGLTHTFPYPGNGPIGTPMRHHPFVSKIQPGSPAADAGLATNDTILSSNGKDARLGRIFPDRTPGTVYTLQVRRNGVERQVQLTVGPERAATPLP